MGESSIGKSLAANAQQIPYQSHTLKENGNINFWSEVVQLNCQDERSKHRKLRNDHFAFLHNIDSKGTKGSSNREQVDILHRAEEATKTNEMKYGIMW